MKLTVFTPTYNRAYILPKLYESLKVQTSTDFEWVIVDDGSSDGTEQLVSSWKGTCGFDIRYIKQENQGKHIAINTGVTNARGLLFFIVDSDDMLKPDAVEKVNRFWETSTADDSVSGIISYREFFDGRLVGTSLPSSVTRCKLRDTSMKYNSVGDKVVIYRTDILRRFPYPKFGNERFLGESYVFNQIDNVYDMLVMDERIYRFGYQTDGLSQDFRKLYRNNPLGFKASFKQNASLYTAFKPKVKNSAHIMCLSIATGDAASFFAQMKSVYGLLAAPLSLILYFCIFVMKASDVKPFERSED